MNRSEAKRKVQSLVDKVQEETGSKAWLAIISEKGTVEFVVVNSIEGGSISAAKKQIRSWAKTNKVKLKWINTDSTRRNPKKKKTATKKKTVLRPLKNTGRRRKKRKQIPPPFKKLTKKKIKKLRGLFRVHDDAVMNPDPGDCPNCGMKYDDLKTGLDFRAVKDMLWIQDSNPEFWRQKGRGSVLGLWFEIKRGMWADHLEMCGGKPISESEYLDFLEDVAEY